MLEGKTPERVNDEARPEHSDLLEIAKQSGEFKKHYGKWWGGYIQLQFMKAASGRRSFWWTNMLAAGTVAGGLWLRYGVPILG
jgi:hypothetical protein